MNRFSKYSLLALAAAVVFPAAAQADWHHGHDRGHYYHPYYGPHYIYSAPRPVYYYPAPVYVQAPQTVVVQQPAYYQQPQMAQNGYCREFTRTIYIDGVPQKGYGNACLQPDGSWQLVD